MVKAKRQQAILSIIRQQPVTTQEELVQALASQGLDVTQATISRDIRELKLIKVANGAGYRYAEPAQPLPVDVYGRVRRAFADYVISIEHSGNLVVVKTNPGTANAVAASIDDASFPKVLATLAGDDVVLIITRPHNPTAGPSDPAVQSLLTDLHALWRSRR